MMYAGIGAALTGGVCYVLAGQQRTEEIAVVVWMAGMVFWFAYRDHEVDSYQHEHDHR